MPKKDGKTKHNLWYLLKLAGVYSTQIGFGMFFTIKK